MINVKLIVLLTCVDIVLGNSHCEICSNHTLCKYTMPGSGVSCKFYDKTVLLYENDINDIVMRINERRNYVAMGYSKFLPAAANMRKIQWSEDLASSAQRWVDQCDQSLWPDKQDQCRNLKNEAVGQNIATVLGASSAINVKSFVDTWFIQILDYSGSVSYYNQSRDGKTKYFTQMIWADTSLVGCGRARFYIDHRKSMAERLVCNFAPQGNLHGKPVYAIGYPATQCADKLIPDESFNGLCRQIEPYYDDSSDNGIEVTSSSPKVSSLLRILNLSNSSAKQAIDPIRNNFKPIKPNVNHTMEQRNQKIRHIENNSFGSIDAGLKYNINPLQITNFGNNHKMSEAPDQGNYQERGHSRVYHGHHHHKFEQITIAVSTEQNYRRYNFMTETYDVESSPNYIKHFRNEQCTRKGGTTQCNTEINSPNVQCTRGQYKDCKPTQHTDQCQDVVPRERCTCDILKPSCTTPPIPKKCMSNVNCQCLNINNPTTRCANYLRTQDTFLDHTRKPPFNLDYYDQFPNIAIRSGVRSNENQNVNKVIPISKFWQQKSHTSIQTERQTSLHTKKYNHHKKYKNWNDYKESYDENLSKTHKTLEFYKRHRRNSADKSTYKPFWQIDESKQKISPELKSLRYTTLYNKRNKYKKPPTITESITINLSENKEFNRKILTEKYLSFDELMHLRKLGESDIDIYGARRTTKKAAATTAKKTAAASTTKKAAAATTAKNAATASTKATAKTTAKASTTAKTTAKATTTTKTTTITANTPFERKKHCTRKLTCTWTAVTITGADGSVIGGMEIEVGSLTPPGYVDGCTRTSTCTRIFMNRNKFSTIGDIGDDERGEEASGEDPSLHGNEDYCEKRALDIRRRESGIEQQFHGQTTPDAISQVSSTSSFYGSHDVTTEKMDIFHSHESSDCTCDENLRVKRDEIHYNSQSKTKESLSYGDLFYRVLQKVLGGWRNYHPSDNHKCACNNGFSFAAKPCIIIIFNYLLI